MKSNNKFSLLIYFLIFGILLTKTTSTNYKLKLHYEELDILKGPLKFLLKNAGDPEDKNKFEKEMKIDFKNGTNEYTATCKLKDENEYDYECDFTDLVLETITSQSSGKDDKGNTYEFVDNNGKAKDLILNEVGNYFPGYLKVTSIKPKAENGIAKIDAITEIDLPDYLVDHFYNISTEEGNNITLQRNAENPKEVNCIVNGVKPGENITIKPIQEIGVFLELPSSLPKDSNGNYIISIPKESKSNGVPKNNKEDHNHLGAAGIVGIVLAALAGLVGLVLCIACCNQKSTIPPPESDTTEHPIVIPEAVVPQQPIVIDSAHAVIPSPNPQPLPTPILPPPRPVVPVMSQPVAVPVVQPAAVPVVQQPTPVVQPVVTNII